MLLFATTIITGVALFVSMRIYRNENGRIPAASTTHGKEARFVVGSILGLYLLLLALNVLMGLDDRLLISWVGPFVLGASLPILLFIYSKKKKK